MPLQKQPININFGQGLDTKSDPFQIPLGRFASLNNSVFTKGNLLTKRNGFGSLTSLPDTTSTFVTTFNGNLTAIGNKLEAYNSGTTSWINKGAIQPCQLSVLPTVRNALNQTQCDAVVATNNLICTVYSQSDIVSGSAVTHYYYAIDDSVTGQNIVAATQISTPSEAPRVFALGAYFLVVYTQSANIKYIAIPIQTPTAPLSAVTLATNYSAGSSQLAWDGVVYNNQFYMSYNASDGGGAIRGLFINANLTLQVATNGVVIASGKSASMVSITADQSTGNIWTFFYLTSSTTGYVVATDSAYLGLLSAFSSPVSVITSTTVVNITCAVISTVLNIYYEVTNNYSYDSSVASNYINTNTITTAASVGTATTLVRSVGIAAKAMLINSKVYLLTSYTSPYQPSYFLLDGSANVVARLAYQNGGGYLTTGIPGFTLLYSVTVLGTTQTVYANMQTTINGVTISLNSISLTVNGVSISLTGASTYTVNGVVVTIQGSMILVPYLIKDFIQAVNKGTNLPTGTATAGIYSQTGINMATFNLTTNNLSVAEIGSNLNITGGFLWMYDGYKPVEQNFFLYPDSDPNLGSNGSSKMFSFSSSGGNITTQTYYYQFIYQWEDQEGNVFRSAPSVPAVVNSADLSGSSNTITIKVPNLRLTYKANVQTYIYRWSTAQQSYYQLPASVFTSATVGSDITTFTDTYADSSILGNALIYTTGSVVEDIGPPAFSAVCLYQSRLMGIEAEDPNTLWYSKQVISATPVEMSDLFTIYTAPTTGAQGSTGPTSCIFPMDDKLILFKKNSGIYYITGIGPDNTGANNSFSDAVFVTSTIGCSNQSSIVLIPMGLMFQDGTGKGIWLLGRDLSTQYIGAPVEQYNAQTVTSAFAIPGTNQVRFTLNNGIALVYDYYFQQWSTFNPLSAISSCIYNNLHTYISSSGAVYQETPGVYFDGALPVNMSFTTGWINMAGLQGYQRAYEFYLLGKYLSPHKLNVSIAYDYNPSPRQNDLIAPNNYSATWGSGQYWGDGSVWGGPSQVEQWRVFLQQQQCESFQITLTEQFDGSYGVSAGAGLTISGLNLIVGVKKASPRLQAAVQVG